MTKVKRIFIVGHTGAGKSERGELLAKKLGWQYVDANLGLERYIGRNLDEIMSKSGEEAFHQCEAEIISNYIGKDNIVVALEEAVIATEKNRKLLASEFVVYSKVSIPMQMERWTRGRSPLLPIVDLEAFLDKQHVERDSLFEEVAKLTVELSSSAEEDVNKIMQAIEV